MSRSTRYGYKFALALDNEHNVSRFRGVIQLCKYFMEEVFCLIYQYLCRRSLHLLPNSVS